MPGKHVILGATSEIGRAIADNLAKSGETVLLAARDADEVELLAADLRIRHGHPVHIATFSADDFSSHPAFVDHCQKTLGGLTGVVACHGFMADQQSASADWKLARHMIDVNFASVVSLGNLFAEVLAEQRSGYLCVLGSVAGDRGRQSNYLYGATKAATTTYLQGLRNRMHKHNVQVVTVKPGFVDTSMTWGLINSRSPLVASPERVARDVCRAVERKKDTVYTPWFWWFIMSTICCIPERIFKRLSL